MPRQRGIPEPLRFARPGRARSARLPRIPPREGFQKSGPSPRSALFSDKDQREHDLVGLAGALGGRGDAHRPTGGRFSLRHSSIMCRNTCGGSCISAPITIGAGPTGTTRALARSRGPARRVARRAAVHRHRDRVFRTSRSTVRSPACSSGKRTSGGATRPSWAGGLRPGGSRARVLQIVLPETMTVITGTPRSSSATSFASTDARHAPR